MTYADPEKRREYAREAMRKKRGITTEGITAPVDVIPDSHMARSWKSVAKMQGENPEGLRKIVMGVVEKGHGGLVRWGASGPVFQDIGQVFFGAKPLADDADQTGPMADEFSSEEVKVFAEKRARQNVLVISRLPQAQRDELYRGLQVGKRGEI